MPGVREVDVCADQGAEVMGHVLHWAAYRLADANPNMFYLADRAAKKLDDDTFDQGCRLTADGSIRRLHYGPRRRGFEIRHTEWVAARLYRTWRLSDWEGVVMHLAGRLMDAYWGDLAFLDASGYRATRWYGE